MSCCADPLLIPNGMGGYECQSCGADTDDDEEE